jgi:putative endonuclease
MKYFYHICSIKDPKGRYIGLTADLKARLAKHNSGGSPHTSSHRPWEHVTFIRFEDDAKATAFETCLKSGSGRAFANTHSGDRFQAMHLTNAHCVQSST